jgi:hypothetical protein
VRTSRAANLGQKHFHQSAGFIDSWHGTNRRAALIAFEIGLVSAYLYDKATTAIHAARQLVRNDRVALFILGHTLIIFGNDTVGIATATIELNDLQEMPGSDEGTQGPYLPREPEMEMSQVQSRQDAESAKRHEAVGAGYGLHSMTR